MTNSPDWAGALDAYSRYLAASGRRPLTIRQHTFHVGLFARTSGLQLGQVTEPDLLAYLGRPDWKPNTRKSARGHLRSFFGWAAGRGGLLDVDPAAELPTVRVPAGKPHPIGEAALQAALDRANDAQTLALLLGGYAGLRRSEIAAVHPRDLVDGLLRVPDGKGGRSRVVPAHPRLVAAIGAELQRRKAGTMGSGFRYYGHRPDPTGWLLPGQQPGSHITAAGVGQMLGDLLGPGASAHGLRHRFATMAYRGTNDLRAVQELLGHSDPATTARYVALSDDSLVAAVRSIA